MKRYSHYQVEFALNGKPGTITIDHVLAKTQHEANVKAWRQAEIMAGYEVRHLKTRKATT